MRNWPSFWSKGVTQWRNQCCCTKSCLTLTLNSDCFSLETFWSLNYFPVNSDVAQGMNTTQSSTIRNETVHESHMAVDGRILDPSGKCAGITHTAGLYDKDPWWQVDLGAVYKVIQISFLWRLDTGTKYLIGRYYSINIQIHYICYVYFPG